MWLWEVAHVSNHLQKADNGKFLQSHLALPYLLHRLTQTYFGHNTASSLNYAIHPELYLHNPYEHFFWLLQYALLLKLKKTTSGWNLQCDTMETTGEFESGVFAYRASFIAGSVWNEFYMLL